MRPISRTPTYNGQMSGAKEATFFGPTKSPSGRDTSKPQNTSLHTETQGVQNKERVPKIN